jgi:hypothetical protein
MWYHDIIIYPALVLFEHCHDIAEILLKVALNTMTLNLLRKIYRFLVTPIS